MRKRRKLLHGAKYHVMARANRREMIPEAKEMKEMFLKVVKQIHVGTELVQTTLGAPTLKQAGDSRDDRYNPAGIPCPGFTGDPDDIGTELDKNTHLGTKFSFIEKNKNFLKKYPKLACTTTFSPLLIV